MAVLYTVIFAEPAPADGYRSQLPTVRGNGSTSRMLPMHAFEYYTPTQIVFGAGGVGKTAELVKKHGAGRVLVVYGGGSAKKSGLIDRLCEQLRQADIAFETLGGVHPNPRLGFAREGVKLAGAFRAELILAVGGGSVIDTCKAIAHGAANPGTDIWEFWKKRQPLTKSMTSVSDPARSCPSSIPTVFIMLHTTSGFLYAAVGFSLVDVLNRNSKLKFKMTPLYMAIVAFCFSMMISRAASAS